MEAVRGIDLTVARGEFFFVPPGGPFTRVDTDAQPGTTIPPDYDPLIGKISVWASDRAQAIARMDRALGECTVSGRGVHTTAAFLRDVLAHPLFRDARHATTLVETMLAPPATMHPPAEHRSPRLGGV